MISLFFIIAFVGGMIWLCIHCVWHPLTSSLPVCRVRWVSLIRAAAERRADPGAAGLQGCQLSGHTFWSHCYSAWFSQWQFCCSLRPQYTLSKVLLCLGKQKCVIVVLIANIDKTLTFPFWKCVQNLAESLRWQADLNHRNNFHHTQFSLISLEIYWVPESCMGPVW